MTITSSGITDGAGADRQQQIVALLKSIETGATEPLRVVDARAYKQHNLGAEDGIEGEPKSAFESTRLSVVSGRSVASTDVLDYGPRNKA